MSGAVGLRRQILAWAWLLVTVPLGAWVLRGLVAPVPAAVVQVEEPFTYGLVSPAARLNVRGFRATPRGFELAARSGGDIEYRVRTAQPLTRWSAVTLQWYGGEAGVQSTVELVTPDGPQTLLRNRSMAGTRFSLPESVVGGTEIFLRFEARNATDQERMLLDKLVLQSWDRPLPVLPDPVWLVGTFLAVALGIAGLTTHPGRTALVGLALALALALRYVNLLRVAMAPLDPDAQGYRAYARMLTWIGPEGFYSAAFGEREPLFPAIAKLAFSVLGDSDLALRMLTMTLSIAVVYLGYRLGREVLGIGGGLATALLLGVAAPAIIESGRGLRVEMETLLLVSAAWLLMGKGGAFPWTRAALAGTLCGALLLTRSAYAPALAIMIPVAAWWWRADRRVWRQLLVAAGIAAILVLPHRLALATRHGDPAYDVHRTLRWVANQEFAGQPGFPPAAALIQDPYAGPPLTLGQYYFGLHSPWEVIGRSLRGLGKAVLNLSPVGYVEEVRAVLGLRLGWVDLLIASLGVVGLSVLAFRRDAAWVPAALLLALAHVAFLYDLSLPDYRFRTILQGMPFFAVAVAAAGCCIAARMLAMFRSTRPVRIASPSPSGLVSTGKTQ